MKKSWRSRDEVYEAIDSRLIPNSPFRRSVEAVADPRFGFDVMRMFLPTTPAMAVGVTDRLWEIEDLLALLALLD